MFFPPRFTHQQKPKKLKCKIWFVSIKTVLSEWTRLDKTWFSQTTTRVGYASKQTLEVNKPGDKMEGGVHPQEEMQWWHHRRQKQLIVFPSERFAHWLIHKRQKPPEASYKLYCEVSNMNHSRCEWIWLCFSAEYKKARQEIKKRSSDTLKLQKKAKKGLWSPHDEWTLIHDVTQATFYYIKHKLESRCCL